MRMPFVGGVCIFAAVVVSGEAVGGLGDPAARGLDAFVHGAGAAPSGGVVRLDVETFGFEQITTPAPLGGVAIDAAWDPVSFGEAKASAPPAVHVESDANGRAIVVVPVPEGDARELKLLVGLRHGAHARTRVINVSRTKAIKAAVHVSQRAVVPGSTVPAWIHVTRATSDNPVQNANVDVSLFEGSYARTKLHARTDAAGMALVRVPIPNSDDPADSWSLTAVAELGGERASTSEKLTPRDETPGAPYFDTRFDVGNVRAGAQAPFTIVLRDASATPIAGATLRYWIGQNGLAPPSSDEDWEKTAIAATTDLRGEVHAKASAPVVVAPNGETQLHLVARGEVQGQKVAHEAFVPVTPSAASATVDAESDHVVPGIEQRLMLHVRDGLDAPVVGAFDVEADGLREHVTTDAHGDAEITWRTPETLGAFRAVGPCAGGVAAAVRVRATGAIEALRSHPEPFTSCVPIDRDAWAIVVPEKRVVRVGENLVVRVASRDASARAWSATLGHGSSASHSFWIDDGTRGASLAIPEGEPGIYDLTVASPAAKHGARVAHTSILVAPASIPHIEAKVVGGRTAPGGTVEVDATLTDEAGKPVVGTVAAMLVDLEGGGSLDGVLALDTRTHLCDVAGGRERCSDLLSNEAASEPLRRALLGPRGSELAPLVDPGASVKSELDDAFSEVLHSLEGAVYTSSLEPDRLIDVRRKGPGGFAFNPELMTLTTAAMDHAPLTPGGEAITLGDLAAIDGQVTFDTVARRVTRYKLFKVLEAVRTYKMAHALDSGEPALRDPNALLRRIVRAGSIQQGMLVDPWGGSMEFVKSGAPSVPFINTIPGFELRAPGPNGILGDGDDVHDPFVRVVRSGTPYARAMSEDQLVDARLDMEVAEATVTGWSTVMETATGTALGSIGLIGHGEGGSGSGQGFGSGHGSLRGGHALRALTTGDAYFQPPQRTDDQGHVHFSVPLGDIETTWGLGLLALPDHGPPASTKLELVASQPVSLAANAGAVWTAGDEMDVHVLVRNRTTAPVEAAITITTEGVASLVVAAPKKPLHVDAQSVASFPVRVRASRAGEAVLRAKLEGTGVPSDSLRFSWDVLPYGEIVTRTAARWVEGTGEVKLDVNARDSFLGRARLVLSRGPADSLEGALSSLEPDNLRVAESVADVMEASSRIERFGPPELHDRAVALGRRASERLHGMLVDRGPQDAAADTWLLYRRFRAYAQAGVSLGALRIGEDSKCPPALTVAQEVVALGVLPHGQTDIELPCWETLVAEATSHARDANEPTTVARALLALADRSERAIAARTLADKLRAMVRLAPSGAIQLVRGSRSDRTLVYAALLRANKIGTSLVSSDRLAAWIAVDRDASGSFGSPEASRAVVRALTATGVISGAPQSITIVDEGSSRTVTLGPSGVVVLGLGERTTKVGIHAPSGIVARLERPMIRSFSNPPDESDSPLHIDVQWPTDARAGHVSTIHVTLGSGTLRSEHGVARIPLPPGASMVSAITGVTQVHGTLLISHDISSTADAHIDIPLRFTLSGHATVREPRLVTPRSALNRALATSQSITIH